ncbi:hypothetical protein J6P68_02015 [bacterium]|nr:hypothetical protein [bacterium]
MTNKVSLMSSILQYAMEGKLVSQNKNDSKSEEFLFYLLKNKGKKYNKVVFDNGKYYEIIKGIKKDVSKEISVKIPEC